MFKGEKMKKIILFTACIISVIAAIILTKPLPSGFDDNMYQDELDVFLSRSEIIDIVKNAAEGEIITISQLDITGDEIPEILLTKNISTNIGLTGITTAYDINSCKEIITYSADTSGNSVIERYRTSDNNFACVINDYKYVGSGDCDICITEMTTDSMTTTAKTVFAIREILNSDTHAQSSVVYSNLTQEEAEIFRSGAEGNHRDLGNIMPVTFLKDEGSISEILFYFSELTPLETNWNKTGVLSIDTSNIIKLTRFL